MGWVGSAVHTHVFKKLLLTAALGSLSVFSVTAQEDPPSRVARLNYIQGNVSMQPSGYDDWAPAVVNRPFTIGDSLYTDQGAQAELHMDVAVIRMAPQSTFSFLNLDDQTVQIKLTGGNMYFRIRNFSPNQVFEVDTPNAAFTLQREGIYRFDVDPNGNGSFVVVRQGQAEVTGGGQAFTLNPGNSVNLSGSDQISYDVELAPNPDQFDNWCSQRDYHEAHLASYRYVSPSMIGYEDLDDYGGWQTSGEYGAVWYPRHVEGGWAPYHNGHWAWVQPWGWTWVDDAPWGFAPFHYGRWVYVGGNWGWCPGPRVVAGYGGPPIRPQFAPALVAFFGGAHWGVSLSIGGGGPSVGWVPLGFGEVYTPPYHVSQNYFRNVNVSSTTINNTVNITNVYNTTYVNKTSVTVTNVRYVNMTAPGAVTAMPQNAFASGSPVARNAVAVAPAQIAKIQPSAAAVLAPPIAPTRQALAPTAGTRPAPHPPQQLLARQVVAKRTPPPPAASFAAQQAFVQQHPGQPINTAALRQNAPARPAVLAVRQAPAPKAPPVQVHPGQKVGNPVAVGHVPAQPGRPAGAPAAAAEQPRPAAATPANRPVEPARNAPAPAVTPARNSVPATRPETTPAAVRPAEKPQPTPAAHPAPAPAAHTAPTPAERPAARPQPNPAAHPAAPAARPESRPAEPKAAPAAHPAAKPAAQPAAKPAPKAPAAKPAPAPAAKPRPEEQKKKESEKKDTSKQ